MEFSPFCYLSINRPDRVSRQVVSKSFAKGIYLYQPPLQFTPIYEIVSGLVKIGTYSSDGKEVCFDILGPGDFFGNLRYLEGQFFEFSKSLTKIELRVYEHDFFRKLIVNEPAVSEWFNHQVVKRWFRAEDRLFAIRDQDAKGKIQKVLKGFESIRPEDYHRYITYQDLADLTGLTRQTVSKVMKKIEEVGLGNLKC
jgi:CRP-like cAMP-binding protein